jgi:hypothetical protein
LEDTELDELKILKCNFRKWTEGGPWIEVALDKDCLREHVKVVINIRVPLSAVKFLASLYRFRFQGNTLLLLVSNYDDFWQRQPN